MGFIRLVVTVLLLSTCVFANPAETFRDLLYSKLSDTISAEDAAKNFILPKRTLFFSSSSLPIEPLLDLFRDIYPYDLVTNALSKKPPEIVDSSNIIDHNNPITVVIMPGLFSEFLTHDPFHTLYTQESSFRDKWGKKLDSINTVVYDVNKLNEVVVPLGSVTKLGSFDDEQGRPLIKYIYMKPRLGSFESIGHVQRPAKYVISRVGQVLSAMKEDSVDRLYLLGYSWGVPLGLEVLSLANSDKVKYPWITNVKGFVSVAGVVYGAVLADILNPFLTGDALRKFNVFKHIMDNFDPLRPRKNILLVKRALKKLNEQYYKRLARIIKSNLKDIQAEGLEGSRPFEPAMHLLGLIRKVLAWDSPRRNLDRLNILSSTLVNSNAALLTSTRMNWWKNNTVPSHVKYYTVSSVNKNPTDPETGENPMRDFPFYGPNSNDAMIMRIAYYFADDVKEAHLNDGAVSVSQSNFKYGIHKFLNFRQKRFKHRALGVMACHHLGIALPSSLQKKKDAFSRFPRKEMIDSLIQTVSIYE